MTGDKEHQKPEPSQTETPSDGGKGLVHYLGRLTRLFRHKVADVLGPGILSNLIRPAPGSAVKPQHGPAPAAHVEKPAAETEEPVEGDTSDDGTEAHETVDKLDVAVKGKCKTPGPYVGLNGDQRKKLGVKEKDYVELFYESGKSLGVFIVGKITNEVLDATPKPERANVCTANVPDGLGKISVKKTEKKIEEVFELNVTVMGKCKSEGAYIGLSEYNRLRLGVEVGETIAVAAGPDLPEFYTVGEITEDAFKKTDGNADVVTINLSSGRKIEELEGKTIRLIKKPEKLATNLQVSRDVETKAPVQRSAKIEERFGADTGVQKDCYITLPNPIARELGCPYPPSKPEPEIDGKKAENKKTSNNCMISKIKVKVGNQSPIPMIVVPSGHTLGLTSAAAKKLNISGKQVNISVEDGVLAIAA